MNDNKIQMFSIYSPDRESNSPDTTENKVSKIKKDLQGIAEALNEFIESIEPKLSYKKYLDMLGEAIDKKIIAVQKEQHITFIGGKLRLKIDQKNNSINFEAEYYYKNSLDKWITNKECGKTRISKLDINDPETVDFLSSKGIIEISIDPPNDNL